MTERQQPASPAPGGEVRSPAAVPAPPEATTTEPDTAAAEPGATAAAQPDTAAAKPGPATPKADTAAAKPGPATPKADTPAAEPDTTAAAQPDTAAAKPGPAAIKTDAAAAEPDAVPTKPDTAAAEPDAAAATKPGVPASARPRRWFGRFRAKGTTAPGIPDQRSAPASGQRPSPSAEKQSGAAGAPPVGSSSVQPATGSPATGLTSASSPAPPATSAAISSPGTPPASAAAGGASGTPPASSSAAAGGASGTPPVTGSPAASPSGEAGKADKSDKSAKAKRDERPPGAPPDPWTVFAAIPEQPPSLLRRALRATGRALIHEWALAAYASVLLAVAMTWPTLRYPLNTLPHDLADPARQSWQIAWAGHVVFADPVQLWQSNAYFPLVNTYAFGDTLLGYAVFGMLGNGPEAAVLRYNLLFVAAHALLTLGAYALVRQLGARPTGAAVAAVAFAYAPWRLAQEGHLDIVSAGGIPLALAMLARGHGWSLRYGMRPNRRSAGWAAAGWFVATWQITLGFALGIPFAYVLGLILVVLELAGLTQRVRRPGPPVARFLRRPAEPVIGWPLMATNTLGAAVFVGTAMVIAVPYLRAEDSPTRMQEIEFFSPPLRSLLIGPAESRIWGAAHETARASLGWATEMSLLPGFALYALALAGLGFSIWKLRHRMMLMVAVTFAAVLTLGTNYLGGRFTYLPLFGAYPSAFDQRVPGRLMLWVTLLLAILAAGAVDDFVRRARHLAAQRVPPWPGPWLRLAMLTPLLLVAVEGWNSTAHPVVPQQPAAMRTVTGPMLVLPTGELIDQTVQLWSTSEFQKMANGGGTFAAERQSELRSRVASFPDAASVQYLRSIRVNTVLLLRDRVEGTSWERAGNIPVDALGIRREDLPDAVVFRLR